MIFYFLLVDPMNATRATTRRILKEAILVKMLLYLRIWDLKSGKNKNGKIIFMEKF